MSQYTVPPITKLLAQIVLNFKRNNRKQRVTLCCWLGVVIQQCRNTCIIHLSMIVHLFHYACHFIMPVISLCLSFHYACHFIMPVISLCLSFHYACHFIMPVISLCLSFHYACHFIMPVIFVWRICGHYSNSNTCMCSILITYYIDKNSIIYKVCYMFLLKT